MAANDILLHIDSYPEATPKAAIDQAVGFVAASGVLGQVLLETADLYLLSERVALRARTRDLTIVPLAGPYDGQIEVVESVIFGSGRPVVVFRAGESSLSPLAFTATPAWANGCSAGSPTACCTNPSGSPCSATDLAAGSMRRAVAPRNLFSALGAKCHARRL